MRTSLGWLDAICFLAFLYIAFHWTPVIDFLDRAIGVPK